ncbi:hypothetical protein [Pedobacter nototheniae]|uniref:hypothetical protein n=1 Tax=Pedobacter nototheniae TaxID=2488994 RepID=UPI00292D66B2|nr:hypothetical protein [Pedobacter nototheniae]
MEIKQSQLSLEELLVKTSYQTQTTLDNDKLCENPLAFGSGFIVKYENEKFFITADHNLHLDDYEDEIKRTEKEYIVSIFNNYSPPDNFLSTVLTPLQGFYYMEQFNLAKPDLAVELVDITLCMLKDINLQYPFLCDDAKYKNQQKLIIPVECFAQPQADENYFIFGQIKTRQEGIRLEREKTAKNYLRFNSKAGDYLLFNTPEIIKDLEEWAGLSGSPVISENGSCVGVLCSVNVNSNSIFVMPIGIVKMLIEESVRLEKLKGLNDK